MYKQYEAENDKDGVAAAKLRKKLIDTMDSFGLLDAERKPDTDQSTDTTNTNRRDDQSDKSDVDAKKFTKKEKSLYKLDKMWKEAEASGLSVEELNALKEEFAHYQEKVDMYYSLFDDSAKNRYASMYEFATQLPSNCANTQRAVRLAFFCAIHTNVIHRRTLCLALD